MDVVVKYISLLPAAGGLVDFIDERVFRWDGGERRTDGTLDALMKACSRDYNGRQPSSCTTEGYFFKLKYKLIQKTIL